MTLKEDGNIHFNNNVGIGDFTPECPLDVYTNIGGEHCGRFTMGSSGNSVALSVKQDGGSHGLYIDQNYAATAMVVDQSQNSTGIEVKMTGAGMGTYIEQRGANTGLVVNSDQSGQNICKFHGTNAGSNGVEIRAGNTSGQLALSVQDGSAQTSFKIDGAGQIYTPRMAAGGGDYNVEYVSGGQLRQDSSTRRLKTNERELEVDTSDIYKMNIKSFNWDTDDITHSDMGLIAEDVQGINEFFVVMDHWKDETEVSPTAVRNKRIMWAMLVEMQKLNDKVTALENA